MASLPLRRRLHLSLVVSVLLAGITSSIAMQPGAAGPARSAPSPVVVPVPRAVRPPVVPAAKPVVVPVRVRSREVRPCSAPEPVATGAPTAASPGAIGPADRWAVLVGVQDYAGSTHHTLGGRGDVVAVRAALLHSGWRSDHVLTLLDCQASGQAITAAMSWLADRSGPSTYSLFHFSGHACIVSRGPCAAGHTYLWGQDNTFIPETTVGRLLGRVRGPAWFDFAACEAGAFDAGLSSPQRLVTGSSQPHETAYEVPDWKESVWSGFVWDQAFLQGKAGEAPGAATIGEMVTYGKEHAPGFTAGQARGPQHPYVAGGDPAESLFAPRT